MNSACLYTQAGLTTNHLGSLRKAGKELEIKLKPCKLNSAFHSLEKEEENKLS